VKKPCWRESADCGGPSDVDPFGQSPTRRPKTRPDSSRLGEDTRKTKQNEVESFDIDRIGVDQGTALQASEGSQRQG
jgi:hypothetical protein